MHGTLWNRQRNSRFVPKKKKNEPVQMRYEMREFRVKFSCSNVQATYLISKQTTTDSFLRVSCSFLFHAFLRLINFFSSSSRSFSIVSIFGSSHLNAEFSIQRGYGKKVFKKRRFWFSRHVLYRRSVLSTRSRFIYAFSSFHEILTRHERIY